MNVGVRAAESRFPKATVLMLFSIGIFMSSLCCVGAVMSGLRANTGTSNSAFVSGSIAGGFWAPGQMLLVTAIMSGGLSLCQGACSGSVIVSSYLFGIAVQHEPLKNVEAGISGLVILVLGVIGLIGAKGKSSQGTDVPQNATLIPLCKSLVAGVLVAFGGLMASIAETSHTDVSSGSPIFRACCFQAAFGCTQFAVHVVAIGSWMLLQKSSDAKAPVKTMMPLLEGRANGNNMQTQGLAGSSDVKLSVYVLCGGLMFTCAYLGNIFSIAYFGLSIGFPCSQLSLVLSSAWGIILFQEVRGTGRIAIMIVSAVMMVLGAVLLTMSKS